MSKTRMTYKEQYKYEALFFIKKVSELQIDQKSFPHNPSL